MMQFCEGIEDADTGTIIKEATRTRETGLYEVAGRQFAFTRDIKTNYIFSPERVAPNNDIHLAWRMGWKEEIELTKREAT